MSNFTGMDVNEVRNLAQRLNTSAEQIRDLMSQLTSALQSTPWKGPDREQFVGEWEGTHVTALNNVIAGLRDASQKANRNAADQEATSSSL